jgi:hypothetical protein
VAGQRPLQLVADHVILHFSLLSHFEGVIYLNSEIANCTLQFGMPEQEVNRPKILGPSINQ